MNISIGALVLAAMAAGQDDQVQILQKIVHELREEVAELKNKDDNLFNKQRAEEVRLLVHDVLVVADSRASLQGSGALAGYNNSDLLQSEEGNWELKINGQIQARWLLNEADSDDVEDEYGFEQRRTQLKFSGYVIDPSWQYKVTATWGRDDASSTEDAYISKQFDNGSWFKFGQYKAGFLRENIVSSSKQLGVERSMLNNAFSYGWTKGIEYGWRKDEMGFVFQYNDGRRDGGDARMIARLEYRIGEAGWKDFGYLTSKIGAKEGTMIGFSYQNLDGGTLGLRDERGWSIDTSWRGDGWNLLAYFVETGIDSSGWLLQGGYMINDNTEIFAKHQEGRLHSENDMSALSAGFNYWPQADSNSVKWSTDVSWASGLDQNSTDWTSTGNGWRSSGVSATPDQMLVRTQLQLLF